FNSKKLVQIDYILLNVKGRAVIVGYLNNLGRDADAKYLFDLKGPAGMSIPGWDAQAHIISSETGKKNKNRGFPDPSCRGRNQTTGCSGRAISMSLMQDLSLAAVRARRSCLALG